ncbi:MAG: DUF1549 domain-containing protein [Verrucomicrobiota bacterium]
MFAIVSYMRFLIPHNIKSRCLIRIWTLVTVTISILVLTESAVLSGETHWAFRPVSDPPLPSVRDTAWPQQGIDYFILSKLEAAGIKPAPSADKHTLIRRVYFDLIGLPPTPEQVEAFLADDSDDAYAKLIDTLLESSHYGERWGRHWLDVARYGDSNGGDENHHFPHAWRYRNWVIDAFNRDLPFDQFLREQLAGDLLEPLSSDRLTATAFLAIGTKVIAEKDSIKKQADIIDEQLDTIGRAFLGLSIGCARCHDHKFDPIPTKDYYALAGIFRSIAIKDRVLLKPELDAFKESFNKSLKETGIQIADAEKAFEPFSAPDEKLEWEAETFIAGNVQIDTTNKGKGIGVIWAKQGGEVKYFADYDIEVKRSATYLIRLRYAAQNLRVGKILIDDKLVLEKAFTKRTGGWMPENQQWVVEGQVELLAGKHKFGIETKLMMANIDKMQLIAVRSDADVSKALKALQQVDAGEEKRGVIMAEQNAGPITMAVNESKIREASVNLRGDPHDLGEVVPRGFLTGIGASDSAQPGKQSGRLELANWMSVADHPLTSRVAVNRIWLWHFGRGLVGTPDNFGTTGEEPSHPELLDYLASQFVKDGWSVKALHRKIMLSSVYQMSSSGQVTDGQDANYSSYKIRRVEAEAFRDSVLKVSGTLVKSAPAGASPEVNTRGPGANRKVYEQYPHRSVYLPVVRSHVYDLLTLLDFPNASTPVGKRNNTTVASQALLMLNNPFLIKKAELLGVAVRREQDPLNELYMRLFSRPVSDEERSWAENFLKQSLTRGTDEHAWTLFCQTLLISNDFLYIR